MAIILEGPDAAGKTTLGRLLAGQFGMKLVVSGGAPRNPNEVVDYCEMQLKEMDDPKAVIDRITPISHPIYNPLYRGNTIMDWYLERMLNRDDVVMVYCRPPTADLMRPEKHAWKDYDTEDHKQKILNNQMVFIELYDEFFSKWPHLQYDYTQREEDHCVELIAMLAATQNDPQYAIKLRTFYHNWKGAYARQC